MARDSHCAFCDGLLVAALETSCRYHELLGTLEAAHIRHDAEPLFRIQERVSEALLERDHAINALADHERSHAMADTLQSEMY